MQVQTYLFFDGRCEEALEYYRTALGAQVTTLMRFKDSPEPQPPPGEKIMHANFQIGETQLMASDSPAPSDFKGFSLSLNPTSDAEAQRLFTTLAEGGSVQMALGPTFFASSFGMVTDRFGVPWMLVVTLPQ